MNIGRKALLYNETVHQTIWFVKFLSRIFVFVSLSLFLFLSVNDFIFIRLKRKYLHGKRCD